ncbi:hypothetical protein ACP70R_042463 [Stipagrostis hirtigluma subsp. patula]
MAGGAAASATNVQIRMRRWDRFLFGLGAAPCLAARLPLSFLLPNSLRY